MENVFETALKKVVSSLEAEGINYMLVGGFAVSYHNRARTTNDIDIVLQIYPRHVKLILNHFPDWKEHLESFEDSVKTLGMFNLTDLETGIRFDFMKYDDSEYNWQAFERREEVEFMGIRCHIISKEDLILTKLIWYQKSKSERQLEDLKFLTLDDDLNRQYIAVWAKKLNLRTDGILE